MSAKYLIGLGKLKEILAEVNLHQAELVLFNYALTPSQERNLENFLNCRVIDRARLILDIFACRAHTFEGRLQVELAQLQYLSTRLVKGWTHLERQRGGIGLRGPGETQLELDRRLIAKRIKTIKRQLEKVKSQRSQGRQSRKKANIPIISLVGYTNAGKSTLFNSLTQSHVYAEDQLFATLDPTLRRLNLPGIGPVIMVDTVGFIQDLPHQLIEAFHATLEETQQADLLLHVIDGSSPYQLDLIHEVNQVLTEIKADQVPQLHVLNKLDLMPGLLPNIHYNEKGKAMSVWVSALKNTGLDLLKKAIITCLSEEMVFINLKLRPEDSKLRAELHKRNVILDETIDKAGCFHIRVHMRQQDYAQLKKHYRL